jgi:TonB family protein
MTHVLVKPPQAASPWMLAMSVGLHGLVVLLVVLLSVTAARRIKPDEVISRVKLVDAPAGPALVEKIQQGPSKVFPPPHEEMEQTHPAVMVVEPVREALQPTAVARPEKAVIPLSKRKKPLQRVEAKKKPEKKKEEEPPKKKESPESLLEKRLAAIRKDVDNRKNDAAPAPSRAVGSQTDVASGSKEGGSVADEELVRWLELVRNRINSHWSVLGDQRSLQRVTVIAAKVAEDGRLLEASVRDSSGDTVFDTSALRAVFQANPFPQIPSAVMERIRKAGGLALRFTPGGMQ